MDNQSTGTTRKEFFRNTAAVAGAAAIGAIGFTRLAHAEVGPDTITQTASIGLNADKKEEARAALTELVNAVKDNEPGVLAYIAHFTPEYDKVFFFEMYKDEAAMTAHGQQPHMAKIGQAFAAGIFKQPLELVKLERVTGFYR